MAPVRIFGREPALWVGAIAGLLSIGTSVSLPGLSQYQVAAIVAGINALAFLVSAWTVRPIAPATYTNVVAAAAAVSVAYGFDVSSETVGAVNAAAIGVLYLLTRGQVSPTGSTGAVAPAAPEPVKAAAGGTVAGTPQGR